MSLTDDNISDEPTKLEKVKQHLKDNRVTYAVGAGCLTVGTAIGGAVVFRQFGGFPLEINQTAKNQALIQWKPTIKQIAMVKKECPSPIPVLDKTTGIPYPSINQAIKATKETFKSVSKDAQGPQVRWERLPESVFA